MGQTVRSSVLEDNGVANHAYCKEFVRRLNAELTELKKPVKLIPVGTVMQELDQLMRAGKVPGYSRIDQVYRDYIHLLPVGNYIAICTFYAVLLNASPEGLSNTGITTVHEGQRVFSVSSNGQQVLPEVDPVKMGGGMYIPVVKTFETLVKDGELRLEFKNQSSEHTN